MRGVPILLLAAALLSRANEGTKPKAAAAEYPVHAVGDGVAAGAEYMGRTLFAERQSLFIEDYIVVEVAVFPVKDRSISVSNTHFTLRVNGSKGVLMAQAPGMVRASLIYPDWERDTELTVGAQAGNAGVILGQPQQVPRFPGDDRPVKRHPPEPTRAPTMPKSPEPEIQPQDLPVELAIREGAATGPVSGYVYFPYRGKVEKIKSLELLYTPPGASSPLSLRLR
jgi:hypothetical protein